MRTPRLLRGIPSVQPPRLRTGAVDPLAGSGPLAAAPVPLLYERGCSGGSAPEAKGGKDMTGTLVMALLGLAPPEAGGLAEELAPPVRIEAAGRPIDTEVGHAAPFVGDF